MKRYRTPDSAVAQAKRNPAETAARTLAAAEAAAFLARRDRDLPVPDEAAAGGQYSALPLFGRSAAAAQKSTDAIMARVQELGTPTREAASTRPSESRAILRVFSGRRGQALAAVLLVVASSALTARYMAGRQLATVTFVLYAPGAQTVAVSGDFNQWSTEAHLLSPAGKDGRWELTLQLPKGQIYSYNFVIDGEEWIVDPQSPLIQDDGMGGSVSSLLL